MDGSKFNRWLPDFMLGRWGHLLWILPVLSLLWVLLDHKDRLVADEARATFVLTHPKGAATYTPPEPYRSPPRGVSESLDLLISPELLAAAATELGLPARWGVDTSEAASRLGSHVTCETQRYTRLVHLTVTSAPGLDELEACEAIFNQGTKSATFQLIAGIEGVPFIKKHDHELLDRAKGGAHATSGTICIEIQAEPHRLAIDWPSRFRALGIDAICALFYSVSLAFLLAYSLQVFFPRRRPSRKECLPV